MRFREEQEVVITSSGSGGPLASELEVRLHPSREAGWIGWFGEDNMSGFTSKGLLGLDCLHP